MYEYLREYIPTYKPIALADVVKDKPYQVIRRLQSSNRSGNYYILLSRVKNFGLNNAPYCPMFHVVSSRFYYIKIVPELRRHLEPYIVDSNYDIPIPAGQKHHEVFSFLESIPKRDMLILYNSRDWWLEGREPERILDFTDEIFVFDLRYTISDYYFRSNLFNYLLSLIKLREDTKSQGRLTITEFQGINFSLDPMKNETVRKNVLKMLIKTNKVTIYNHLVTSSKEFYVLPLDNKRLIINSEADFQWYKIYSYDHFTIEVNPWLGMLLEHPIPEPSRGVD